MSLPVQQAIVFGTLVLALALFIWGRWRYDVVALIALLIVTVTGLVPGAEAFAGFGHAAVVTVAAALVLSRGLQNAGVWTISPDGWGAWESARPHRWRC